MGRGVGDQAAVVTPSRTQAKRVHSNLALHLMRTHASTYLTQNQVEEGIAEPHSINGFLLLMTTLTSRNRQATDFTPLPTEINDYVLSYSQFAQPVEDEGVNDFASLDADIKTEMLTEFVSARELYVRSFQNQIRQTATKTIEETIWQSPQAKAKAEEILAILEKLPEGYPYAIDWNLHGLTRIKSLVDAQKLPQQWHNQNQAAYEAVQTMYNIPFEQPAFSYQPQLQNMDTLAAYEPAFHTIIIATDDSSPFSYHTKVHETGHALTALHTPEQTEDDDNTIVDDFVMYNAVEEGVVELAAEQAQASGYGSYPGEALLMAVLHRQQPKDFFEEAALSGSNNMNAWTAKFFAGIDDQTRKSRMQTAVDELECTAKETDKFFLALSKQLQLEFDVFKANNNETLQEKIYRINSDPAYISYRKWMMNQVSNSPVLKDYLFNPTSQNSETTFKQLQADLQENIIEFFVDLQTR